MNPHILSKRLLQSGRRVARALPVLLCLFLFSAVPAFADPVKIYQVIQTLNSSTGTPDLKLNSLVSQQDPAKSSTQTATNKEGAGTQTPKNDSVISGVTVTGQGQQLGVEIIEEAEVEGSICDCGWIPPPVDGDFPKWPFLFLAAVPLAFIDGDEEPTPTPTPTVTPTPPPPPPPPPPQVPEPASMLLLGTGLAALGAGVRRRYSKTKTAEQTKEEE